ncbi:MAG: cytochrome c oxidase subunit II transmembrane domain-containing protein [Acidimicrobiia bacterium]
MTARNVCRRFVPFVLGGAVLLAGCETGPKNNQNSLRPEGPASQTILNLFAPWFWVAVVIGVGVVAATFFVAIRYRDKGDRRPKQTHGHTALEIGWTVIPALILAVMGAFTVATIWKLAAPAESNAIKVEAVGKQWWWQFNLKTDPYEVTAADGKKTMATRVVTSGELHIPVGRQIELNVKSCDTPTSELGKDYDPANPPNTGCNVIHSFWIPSLNGKADAVPGRDHRLILKADQPGTYLGQCSEYCGLSHANMRMRVIAQTPADYEAWLENQKKGPVTPLTDAAGKPAGATQDLIINKYQCTNCHIFDDPSKVNYAPNLTHLASRTTIAGASYSILDEQGQIAGIGYEHLWRWIHNASDPKWGVPMQNGGCRFPPPATCVGMPNFAIEQTQTIKGKTTQYPAMSEQEAQLIADYLKGQK